MTLAFGLWDDIPPFWIVIGCLFHSGIVRSCWFQFATVHSCPIFYSDGTWCPNLDLVGRWLLSYVRFINYAECRILYENTIRPWCLLIRYKFTVLSSHNSSRKIDLKLAFALKFSGGVIYIDKEQVYILEILEFWIPDLGFANLSAIWL